jgi:phytoene/squalene synthetase
MTDETDYCEALVRDADKDRFLATLFAPAEARGDLMVLYAFDLETAAVAQRVRDPAAGEIRLQWWHDALSAGHDASGHPVADAVRSMLDRHGIGADGALEQIDARRRALYPDQHRTEVEFELLASETGGTIFRMAAQILDAAPADAIRLAAHHAGVAAAAAEVAPDAVSFDTQAVSARHRYAVKALVETLPDAVLPAFLPLTLAVDGRSHLPQWRKQWILWRASKNLAAWV